MLGTLFQNFCVMITLLTITMTLLPAQPAELSSRQRGLIVLCMCIIPVVLYAFGFELAAGLKIDLRYVPVALATLWAGPLVGLLVATPLLLVRLLNFNAGSLPAVISMVMLILVASLLRRKFNLAQQSAALSWKKWPYVVLVFSLNGIGLLVSPNGLSRLASIYLPLLLLNTAGLYVAAAVIRHRLVTVKTYHHALAQSRLDALTGLPNRRAFDRDLEQLSEGQVVMMLDIDHFKAVNDLYGHQQGDQVLRAVGDTLLGTLRQTDSAYRFGGEEFAVILRGVNEGAEALVGERLRQAVNRCKVGPELGLTVTVSVGLARHQARQGERSPLPADTLKRADQALYDAKAGGRNRVCVAAKEPAVR